MSDVPQQPSAKELAKDIQTNVESALKDPTNATALDALHNDSQMLDGKLSWGPNGELVDHNQPLQNAVQQELTKMEANGTLPKITISESGQIDSSAPLPGVHSVDYKGQQLTDSNVRMLLASPNQATAVWDIKS